MALHSHYILTYIVCFNVLMKDKQTYNSVFNRKSRINVTNAPANAIDGKDVAITKSINMNDWQMNLTKSVQKADPHGKITTIAASTNDEHHGMMGGKGTRMGMEQEQHASQLSTSDNATHVSIVKGAITLGNKAY